MDTQIANPDTEYKISPEALEVAKTYLACHDTKETALSLGIEQDKVTYYLRKPEVKRFVDNIFLEQGYMNRGKLQEVMDKLFELKLEEMEDSEIGSNKDILDIVALQHKMRMEEIKALKEAFGTQTNVKNQVNIQQNGTFGDNYDNLMSRIVGAGNK